MESQSQKLSWVVLKKWIQSLLSEITIFLHVLQTRQSLADSLGPNFLKIKPKISSGILSKSPVLLLMMLLLLLLLDHLLPLLNLPEVEVESTDSQTFLSNIFVDSLSGRSSIDHSFEFDTCREIESTHQIYFTNFDWNNSLVYKDTVEIQLTCFVLMGYANSTSNFLTTISQSTLANRHSSLEPFKVENFPSK